jgi:hypothetical protein
MNKFKPKCKGDRQHGYYLEKASITNLAVSNIDINNTWEANK